MRFQLVFDTATLVSSERSLEFEYSQQQERDSKLEEVKNLIEDDLKPLLSKLDLHTREQVIGELMCEVCDFIPDDSDKYEQNEPS